MSDWPPNNEIAIDTNVFKHFRNRDEKFNPDSHVSDLFLKLVLRGCRLCVDTSNVIRNEYQSILGPLLETTWQIGAELELLRYWMSPDNHELVDDSTKIATELLVQIRKVIIENERVDRLFVCISFLRECHLISNDELHIVRGPAAEVGKAGWRRDRLKKACKKISGVGSEILYSVEAAKWIDQ